MYFTLAFARMKLIRAYVSLYVRKYLLLPPLLSADLLESGCYGRKNILNVGLPTVIKQGKDFLRNFEWELWNCEKNKK